MKKNHVHRVIIEDIPNAAALMNKINLLHIEMIEKKLSQSSLTPQQKLKVIDCIISDLKIRMANDIIE